MSKKRSNQEVVAKLQPWIRQHTRPAWKPQVQNREVSVLASKFCGAPALAPNEAWPRCGACDAEMAPILQLNSRDLPAEFGQPFTGLLQLFYCVSADCECEFYMPFEHNKLMRIVQPSDDIEPPKIPREIAAEFPCKSIVGWKQIVDLPDGEEHEDLGLNYHYDFSRHTVRLECPSLSLVLDEVDEDISEVIAKAQPGDKLGGWPSWVQGVEYPNCPKCSKRMRYLFQIDSEENVPFMWGDGGIGHITRCADHPDVLGFGWACS